MIFLHVDNGSAFIRALSTKPSNVYVRLRAKREESSEVNFSWEFRTGEKEQE